MLELAGLLCGLRHFLVEKALVKRGKEHGAELVLCRALGEEKLDVYDVFYLEVLCLGYPLSIHFNIAVGRHRLAYPAVLVEKHIAELCRDECACGALPQRVGARNIVPCLCIPRLGVLVELARVFHYFGNYLGHLLLPAGRGGFLVVELRLQDVLCIPVPGLELLGLGIHQLERRLAYPLLYLALNCAPAQPLARGFGLHLCADGAGALVVHVLAHLLEQALFGLHGVCAAFHVHAEGLCRVFPCLEFALVLLGVCDAQALERLGVALLHDAHERGELVGLAHLPVQQHFAHALHDLGLLAGGVLEYLALHVGQLVVGGHLLQAVRHILLRRYPVLCLLRLFKSVNGLLGSHHLLELLALRL
ncbi:Uncharacterised protein [uncultured archaeon]|nr:Uncharacterised protein [uncultured archaeon]